MRLSSWILLLAVVACGEGSLPRADAPPPGSPAPPEGPPPPARYSLRLHVSGPGAVTSTSGIECRGECTFPVTDGAAVRFVGVPTGPSFVASWSGPCTRVGAECSFVVRGSSDVEVAFAPRSSFAEVTVYKGGYGDGRIVSDPPGIDCGEACTALFAPGTQLVLRVVSAQPFAWSGDCSGAEPCSLALDEGSRLVLATFPGQARRGRAYAVCELPAPSGASLEPRALDARGVVVGAASTPDGTRAFRSASGCSGTTLLDVPGARFAVAVGVNERGQVAVWAASDRYHAYRWEDGVLTDSGGLPGTTAADAVAYAIGAEGGIVGWARDADGLPRPFLWDDAGLRPLWTELGAAVAIGSSGAVYGWSDDGRGRRLVRFDSTATSDLSAPQDLSAPGQRFWIGGVSESAGVVMGSVRGALTEPLSLALDGRHAVTPLAHHNAAWNGVNDAGDAVGAEGWRDVAQRAVLWSGGEVIDLNASLEDPSWVLLEATAINESGQITGYGLHDGVRAAFLLTPR